jgi:hypothetical protein
LISAARDREISFMRSTSWPNQFRAAEQALRNGRRSSARKPRSRLGTPRHLAARRHEPCVARFQQAGAVAVNDFQREWWVRAALRPQATGKRCSRQSEA